VIPPKPKKRNYPRYDYIECARYIEAKYGVNLTNFAGKKFGADDDTPYQNFWHWLLEGRLVGNPGEIYIPHPAECVFQPHDENAWVGKVLEMFAAEFDLEDPFRVEW
jgi:hypothetical protein